MDKTEHLGGKYYGKSFSYEDDKIRKLFAYFLLFSGVLIFTSSLLGAFDGLSHWTSLFLKKNLGITNRWTHTYGPDWFVSLMQKTSSLGGKIQLILGTILISIFYKLKGRTKLLWKFLFVFLGANFILLILKLSFAEDIPYEPIDLFIGNVAPFPSGHAMISLVFYLTIAVLVSRKQRRKNVRIFFMVSSLVIIFMVSAARVLVGAHTVTEVIAGLSVGLIWLCLCWFAERFLKINYRWDI